MYLGPFRRCAAPTAPSAAHSAFRFGSVRPAPAARPPPPGAMAAAAGDGAAKPLQSAMKLANKAIELDTGNRPRVRLGGARQQLREALGPWWARAGV